MYNLYIHTHSIYKESGDYCLWFCAVFFTLCLKNSNLIVPKTNQQQQSSLNTMLKLKPSTLSIILLLLCLSVFSTAQRSAKNNTSLWKTLSGNSCFSLHMCLYVCYCLHILIRQVGFFCSLIYIYVCMYELSNYMRFGWDTLMEMFLQFY